METLLVKADQIMQRMGFPPASASDGRYVTELRHSIARQASAGLVNRSGGTWATDAIWSDHEERARCLLEIDWAIERGHCCQTEVLDCYPINRRYNFKTGRSHYEFRPDRIMPWVRDQVRKVSYHYRIWRDRNLVNPYSRPKNAE
jgi:hypothetical protein